MPLIGVLALQGGFEAHERVLRRLGAPVREVRTPGDLDGLRGLVIPGGESTTMSLGIEREGLAEPLRELLAGGLPVLGSCAGLESRRHHVRLLRLGRHRRDRRSVRSAGLVEVAPSELDGGRDQLRQQGV